jgi:simple sugar transport system ATP-binding protein
MKMIEFRQISKIFGSRKVLDQISFSVEEGEVHALLGENGAGKSTLVNILFGLFKEDQGEILFKNEVIKLKDRQQVGMVHQHFMLVANMSILENILLARGKFKKKKWIAYEAEKQSLQKEIDELGLGINFDLDAKIRDVTVGSQQKIEIIKMLLGSGSVLIFDEPTAMLTPKEIFEFENLVKKLKKQGRTIIIITHKLSEIKQMADRCSVIRKGKFIQTVDVSTTSENKLAELMVGRQVNLSVAKDQQPVKECVLELKKITAKSVGPIDMDVRQGEILGIAGVDGNGQATLARLMYGLTPIEDGQYYLCGKPVFNVAPDFLHKNGVSYIPEDRQSTGLVLPFTIEENLVMNQLQENDFSHGILMDWKKIRRHASDLISRFDIRPNDPSVFVKDLSGGNQQKVILARELHQIPKLVIAYQPTRGLDVGAIEMIHQQLLDLRRQGVGVILISYELDELLSLSDRLVVLFKGRIVAQQNGPNFDREWVGEAMMGGVRE